MGVRARGDDMLRCRNAPMIHPRSILAALSFAMLALTGSVLAQPTPTPAPTSAWPQKTVRLIIPLPPGSGSDISARMLAERLAERWGQPVVVENRQGADGIPAVQSFLGARDNHTLLLSFAGVITMNPLLHASLPYDPGRDLVPIVPLVDNFLGLEATATLKANTMNDFVRIAREQPGRLNWAATPGLPYYILLALQKAAGIQMVEVPYRDFAPAYQDLTTGRLHIIGTGLPTLVPHHRAGTARLLLVNNRERSPQAPEVPTAAEAGFPELTFDSVVGFFGWRDMPASIKERIATDVTAIVAEPAFRTRLVGVGTIPRTGSASDYAATIEEQRAKIAAIHQASGLKPAQ
jgi:tripartite-type tricarboxylate transporter receptor subunit TctC